MKATKEYCPSNQQDWRNWLELNHDIEESVWLIFYKKKSTKHNLSWSESVDEALCFGWIDSTKRSIDEERFKQYFSRRKPKSVWSKINKDKLEYLISNDLMREAGYKTIEVAKENGSWSILDGVEALVLPDELKKEFNERKGAMEYYENLSKSSKKILLSWIALAKREETKRKRIIDIAENAGKGLMPKPFR